MFAVMSHGIRSDRCLYAKNQSSDHRPMRISKCDAVARFTILASDKSRQVTVRLKHVDAVFYSAWDLLKVLTEDNTHESISFSDAPEIADRLKWIFVEEPAIVDVSAEALRQRFREWALAENPGVIPNLPQGYSLSWPKMALGPHSIARADMTNIS
ncbi:hypothetical protein MCOR21_004183 [Pyricularia oryzae]|nr:hypothetical protein MCOR28_004500 [Pyricularia oryzae]KAI6386895.1 hypothetical protein MCOR32_000676 [Pyricularia oryzae]KAI6431063.1 hypothetical protein MCOR21_004183 [Pyricularia oryzae]KAI6432056.1 hypothetical protein MCOR22_009835 [Pyricularia oryzae]KAI6475438.1 hypothetical protein MCOR17_001566 [Pyricularia oryzae]